MVATVVAALFRAQAVLDAATRSVPALAARLEPVQDAHTEHVGVLVGAVPDGGVPTGALATVPHRMAPALAAVQRSEQRLLRAVRTGCLEARSGDLARVLASIAASTSQHAATLAPGASSSGVPG